MERKSPQLQRFFELTMFIRQSLEAKPQEGSTVQTSETTLQPFHFLGDTSEESKYKTIRFHKDGEKERKVVIINRRSPKVGLKID